MARREPRKDWSLDSEGSSWDDEETYAERKKRERLAEATGDAKSAVARAFSKKDKREGKR